MQSVLLPTSSYHENLRDLNCFLVPFDIYSIPSRLSAS